MTSSAHAHGTKIRGRNFKHLKIPSDAQDHRNGVLGEYQLLENWSVLVRWYRSNSALSSVKKEVLILLVLL